ncbi:kinesin-like protein KIF26A [Megalops cyprinoides]|uniref:kinesin-like protein KIF26A n=1 Tax=Megalops cyprinoides TaxID=118141 RepID=UPI0018647A66|nr:kinesin-like protein KIF26A [Megalops cyprinoides]
MMDWKELAAQKLNLSSRRKKPASQDPSARPTHFSAVLQRTPPPVPPCLLRAGSKVKDNPGMGKVKVMVRVCLSQDHQDTSESMSFLRVDPRRKQLTLCDPSTQACPSPGQGGAVAAVATAPKTFTFDAVFPQDTSQAEVCSGTVAEVIQSVVNGADGCIFCFGHASLGKTYTMIGRDASTQTLGIAPCAISWLFRLIEERRERTGARFSLRASAVEIFGRDEQLQDLLAREPSGSRQGGPSSGVYLREDPIYGSQLLNQTELRAPSPEKAASLLDAALAARSTSRPDCEEEMRRHSHMLFTLHVYQYRLDTSGPGGMSGGRSRLHLVDLGSCEKVQAKGQNQGGDQCLSLPALGNVILALAGGAKHVPYGDSKLTMLLRESLGNINCRTTMIAHISDSPSDYAETLTTIQLASRIHRTRKKRAKHQASSASGGDTPCEEGPGPPCPRFFNPRTLDPSLLSLRPNDLDYPFSREHSCDAVIYVGPGGVAVSTHNPGDTEGLPAFVPIIPSLNRRRIRDGTPVDGDHFNCSTFAELQEQLEFMDDREGATTGRPIERAVLSTQAAKASSEASDSPKRQPHYTSAAHSASGNHFKSETGYYNWSDSTPDEGMSDRFTRGNVEGEEGLGSNQRVGMFNQSGALPKDSKEPVVREKVYITKRPLSKPVPASSKQRESQKPLPVMEGSSGTRKPPVGMSYHAVQQVEPSSSPVLGRSPTEVRRLRSTLRGRSFDQDILRTTVTLQQPVELNGEDELVFTVVEELSVRGFSDNRTPAGIINFSGYRSLQAMPSASHPVAIVSSINDEFDAYTSQLGMSWVNAEGNAPACSRRIDHKDSLRLLHKESFFKKDTANSTDDSYGAVSRKSSLSKCSVFLDFPKTSSRGFKTMEANTLSASQNLQIPQAHSSLPRKMKPTSTIAQSSSIYHEYQRQQGKSDDPWLCLDSHFSSGASESGSGSKPHRSSKSSGSSRKSGGNSNSVPRPPKMQEPSSAQRVVDGCERSHSNKAEGPRKIPLLRREATTLGTVPVIPSSSEGKPNQDSIFTAASLKFLSLRKKTNGLNGARPGGSSPPTPPVGKSNSDQKARILLTPSALKSAGSDMRKASESKVSLLEEEFDMRFKGYSSSHKTSSLKADHSSAKTKSSQKTRRSKGSAGQSYGSLTSLERCDSLTSVGSRPGLSRENSDASLGSKGRSSRSVAKLGFPASASIPMATSSPPCASPRSPCKMGETKGSINPKAVSSNGHKAHPLFVSSSKPPSPSTVCIVAPATRNTTLPPSGKMATHSEARANGKPGRGTIMGTKQAIRAVNSRVSELALGSPAKHLRGSADADSGADSRVSLGGNRPFSPLPPSPYSKITAPRRPQRYSSGHGSDNSSVLSGELPPAMGRTALFYHSGGSSGYESMIRDSEATGSASSAHDSMSESGLSSSGRARPSKSPKKRANGYQRRRLIAAPLPDTSPVGRKAGTTSQWVDLLPLPGTLKEPFEIKVYEIDDMAPLQKRQLGDTTEQPCQDDERGLLFFSARLKMLERRQQLVRDLRAKHERLKEELEDVKNKLMLDPHKWIGEFEVDPDLDKESQEYLEALAQVTGELEYCVNLCKSRVMMETCFDIEVTSRVQEEAHELKV